jgi:hypothetical protein
VKRQIVQFSALGVLAIFSGCATTPTAKEPKTPEPAQRESAESPKPEVASADELYERLTQQPRAEAVLAALPADVRSGMDSRVQQLTADERRALLDPAQPYAYQRPLLHLVAGGDLIGAYSALFSSSATADELVEARYESGQFEDLPPVVTEVAKRAARHVLVRRTAELAPGVARKKEILGEVAAAAEFLGDDAIYIAALGALEREFPDQQWAFMRAGALARGLQAEAARATLPNGTEVDAAMARAADVLIRAAEQVSKPVQSADDAVQHARAQLTLDREQDALKVLSPYASQAAHLGVTTAKMRALAGTGPCPAVRTPLGNGIVCRAAWREFLVPDRVNELQRAWESNTGRDVEAVDVWLGLSHVVPMMYGLQDSADQAVGHLRGLSQGAKAAFDVGPQYRGIELFADTLEKAVGANTTGNVVGEIPKPERKQLIERARALNAAQPNDGWSQAATLATVAVTAPFDDSRTLLLQMNDSVRAEWRITHGSLLLWSILAGGDIKGFVGNKGVLGRAAQSSAEGSYERSRWVVLWAEAEAHLEPGPRSEGIVSELANRLNTDQAPLDLRLRTAIDSAGLLARKGDFSKAAELLGPVVAGTPRQAVSSRHEQELLVTAMGYEHVLRALSTSGEEQARHVAALDDLIASVSRASAAPPALTVWLAAWRAELERHVQAAACGSNQDCVRKAKAKNPLVKGSLDAKLGPQMANLLRRGVLPIGGVALEFRYRAGRLVPQVDVDPAFLLVHMPPLDGSPR